MAHVRDQWYRASSSGTGRERSARYGVGRRWLASYQDTAGRRHAKSFDKKVDAERHLALIGADIARGVWVDPALGRTKFGDYAREWLAVQTFNVSTRRALARRIAELDAELAELDTRRRRITTDIAPALCAAHGIGPDTATGLLLAAGDNPDRLRSERSWSALLATNPIEASSGKITRHRLNRGGDRQGNSAIWRIVIVRMNSDPETKAYVQRRTKEGLSKTEIVRCLKRYVAREAYALLPRERLS